MDKLQFVYVSDTKPVVRGQWITYPECLAYEGAYHDEHIVCSACHSVWNIIDNDTERFNYCPNCGAKMDGERRDEDGADAYRLGNHCRIRSHGYGSALA